MMTSVRQVIGMLFWDLMKNECLTLRTVPFKSVVGGGGGKEDFLWGRGRILNYFTP